MGPFKLRYRSWLNCCARGTGSCTGGAGGTTGGIPVNGCSSGGPPSAIAISVLSCITNIYFLCLTLT